MPSIFKRTGEGNYSPYYYCAFYIPSEDGEAKQVKFSTRRKNRREAEEEAIRIEQDYKASLGSGNEKSKAILEKLKEASLLATNGDLNAHKAQEFLREFLEISTGEELRAPTVGEWCQEWLEERKLHVKPSTYAFYRGAVNSFLSYIGERSGAKIHSLGKSEVKRFRDSITAKGRTAKTANHYLTCLFSCFEKAKKESLITHNPVYGIERLEENDSKSRIKFSDEEVNQLIEQAPSEEWRGVITIGAFTGLRLRDITNLRWTNLNMEEGKESIVIQPRKTSKKKKVVTIPIHRKKLLPFLEELLLATNSDDPSALLFPSLADRETGGNSGVSKEFLNHMKSIGIKKDVVEIDAGGNKAKRLKSFHSLRHYFVSSMANANVSKEQRKKLAGHTGDDSHELYTDFDYGTLSEAVNSI